MDISHVSTALRPRGRWEATDLGFAMVRAWWRPVFSAWLATLGFTCALLAPAAWWHPAVMLILLWWIKPLLDRVLLFVISTALFANPPHWRRSLRQIPRLIHQQWFASLTWRRLDPWRSFHLPVVQLEELRGKKRRLRQQLLRRQSHAGGWLTVTCLIMELCIQIALAALIVMLFPELAGDAPLQTLLLGAKSAESYIPLIVIYVIAIAIIEPFYVAAGFAIYLNRRAWLEAWDLEIGFRRIAQRFASIAPAMFAALLFTATLAPRSAPAESSTNRIPTSQYCRALAHQLTDLDQSGNAVSQGLAKVLRTTDFPACALQFHWVFPSSVPTQEQDRSKTIATLIETLLWLLFASASGGLIYWFIRRRSPPGLQDHRVAEAPPPTLQLPEFKEDFGTDSSSLAATLWSEMRQRDAIALLYRATLRRIGELYPIDFDPSATEDDCLRLSQHAISTADPKLDYFRRLTQSWQHAAYANTLPTDQSFACLCSEWQILFMQRNEH